MGLKCECCVIIQYYLQVSTAYAKSVKEQTFQISVSYENVNDGNRDQLIHVGRLEV